MTQAYLSEKCAGRNLAEEIFANPQKYHGQEFWVRYSLSEKPTRKIFHGSSREFLPKGCFEKTEEYYRNQELVAALAS